MAEQTGRPIANGFHHIAMRVTDFDAAVEFYESGLGFSRTVWWGNDKSKAMLLHAGNGNYIEVFAGADEDAASAGAVIHFALRTDDCDAAIARAVAAGAEVTVPPKDVTIPSQPQPTPVRIAFCRGPSGETIEFFQNELT